MFLWAFFGLALAASSTTEAEVHRLRGVMEKRYRKEVWIAVDSSYEDMIALDKRSDFLTDEDHIRGAMAADSLGNITETIKRLERADSEQASTWKENILRTTGLVQLTVKKNFLLVSMEDFPAFEVRRSLDFINEQLVESGKFSGRLPNGGYQYGDLQVLVQEEETLYIESESLDSSSRKEMKKEKMQSAENLRKEGVKEEKELTPKKVKAPKERVEKPKKERLAKVKKEKAVKESNSLTAVGFDVLISNLVIPIEVGQANISYTNFGGGIGWERAWDFDVCQVGINPQFLFGGQPESSFFGVSSLAFVGFAEEGFFVRFGVVPQFMKIEIPRTEFLIDDGKSIRIVSGGTTFGWGGELQLGWMVNENVAVNFRGRLANDSTMFYVMPSVGMKYYY